MAVWPERADDQKDCHSGKQESASPEIVVLVLEEEIEDNYRHIGEPQQIGDDEHLAEGDIVVRLYMNQVKAVCNIQLNPGKPLHINKPIEQKRQRMPIFIIIEAADSEKESWRILFSGK